MTSYGDYCPIAIGVDVLGDRWTPLVIRELMVGATRFNDIHRGIPRMSRTLLAQRLRQLEKSGLVAREVGAPGRSGRYELTAAGEALTPVVWAIGHWAAEWIFGDPTDEDSDGLSLIWRLHQRAIPAKLPTTRTVVHLVMTGPGAAQGWLEIDRPGITVCRNDQGHDVDLAVEADTAQMQRWLVGRVSFRDLVACGEVRLLGPSRLARAFPTWFDVTYYSRPFRRPGAQTTPNWASRAPLPDGRSVGATVGVRPRHGSYGADEGSTQSLGGRIATGFASRPDRGQDRIERTHWPDERERQDPPSHTGRARRRTLERTDPQADLERAGCLLGER